MSQYLSILITFALASTFAWQAPVTRTPNRILYDVHQRLRTVRDYTADIGIRADIPTSRSVPMEGRISYQYPDQFKVESERIVILPVHKLGDLQLAADTNAFTSVLKGTELFRNVSTRVVHVIPDDESGDLVLGKFWVDDEKHLVLRSILTSRSNGTVSTDYFYGSKWQYGLPDSLVYTVDVKEFKIPKGFAVDLQRTTSAKSPTPATGKIHVQFRNYRINQGKKD